MNRYQLEVAELDRRHRARMRAVSFLGAATVIVAALWAAGVPPTQWLNGVKLWPDHLSEKRAVIEKAPAPVLPVPAATAPTTSPSSPGMAGTHASISAVSLPLLLVSTSPGRSAFEGTATIGTDPTNPQTYAAGALLLNGARLAEIHKQHVVLQRGDKRVRLNLAGPEGAPESVADELLAVGGPVEHAALVAPSHEAITDYIRPSPVFVGEQLRGYEVYAGQNAGVFAQLGLQAGDVIIALNDMPFSDPAQAMDLFRQITAGIAMTATIERKGNRERITVDGALVAADQDRKKQAQAQTASDAGPTLPPG